MGYKVQFDTGEEIEFDAQPSQADIDEAYASVRENSHTQKITGLGSKALDAVGGVAETLTTGVANAFGGLGAAATGSVKGMLTPGSTASQGRDEMLESYQKVVAPYLNAQTNTGKYIEEKIGHVIEDLKDKAPEIGQELVNALPFIGQNLSKTPEIGRAIGAAGSVLPEAAILTGMRGGKGKSAKALEPEIKGPNPEGVLRDLEPSTPVTPEQSSPRVMEEMAQQLRSGEKSVVDFPSNDPLPQMVEQLRVAGETEKAAQAQQLIDRRQAEMEQQVAQKQSLDFNAAERARQQQAEVPGLEREHLLQDQQRRARMEQERQAAQQAELEQAKFTQTQEGFADLQAKIKQLEAQRLAEERQAQMELDVKRQTTLEQGAKDLNRKQSPEMTERLYQDQVPSMIETNPWVQKWQDRISKQEQLIVKLSEQVEKGEVKQSVLARELKNLKNFEEALSRTTKNVEEGYRKHQPSLPFDFKRQGGAINPEVFQKGFQKLKQLADGTWLRAYGTGADFRIEASKNSHTLGEAIFDAKPGQVPTANLEAFHTAVNREARGKGLATEIYKFASELGNDVQASDVQTQQGRAMWEGFEKKGISQNRVIPKKQRGAINLDPKDQGKADVLKNIPGFKGKFTFGYENLTPEKVEQLSVGKQDIKDGLGRELMRQLNKGTLYELHKTSNPVLKFAFERISDADRLSRSDIERYVHSKEEGLGPATRALNDKAKAEIWSLMEVADRSQKELSKEVLEKNGYSKEQIAYWETHRNTMAKGFESINRARAAAGLEPISKREAYAAMRATGDYRRLVYKLDEAGEKHVAGIIGSDFRSRVNDVAALLKEKGYEIGEERYFGGVPRERGGAQQALAHTLEVLAKNDPRIKEFLNTMDEVYKNEAYSFLNAKTHTMQKKGVFGMEGRKTWESAEQNAKDGMKAQLQYLETTLKWGRISEAVEALRPVLENEKIAMPKAKEYAEYYMKNALGYNPSMVGHYLEQAMANAFKPTGVGYSVWREGVAASRKIVNTLLLSLNLPFLLANEIQPWKSMPAMKALVDRSFGDSPGVLGYNYLAKGALSDWKRGAGKPLDAFEKQAFEYAKKKHVYGSDLIEHSTHSSKDAWYYLDQSANYGASQIESQTRRMSFLAFAHMLKDAGVKENVFETAHNLTDSMMNNYSRTERPRIYNTAGPFGDTASNLASFKHNEASRFMMYAREAIDGGARPLASEIMSQVAFAGIKGMILYEEADWIVRQISKQLGKPTSLTQLVMDMSSNVGKAVGTSKQLLSHGMFSLLGVDMSSRLGMNNMVGNNPLDVMFPGAGKLGSIAKEAGTLAVNQDEMSAKRLIREVSPNIVASNLDQAWFTNKQGVPVNRNNLEAQGFEPRTTADKIAKSLGATGIHEAAGKDAVYEAKYQAQAYQDLRKGVMKKAQEAYFLTGKVSPDMAKEYIRYRGDPQTFMKDIQQFAAENNIPQGKLMMFKGAMSSSVAKQLQAQQLKHNYENQR